MKKISTIRATILASLLAIPLVVSAADLTQGFSTLGGLVTTFNNQIVKALITLFATGAMAAFFFGIVQFIWGSRDGDATKAKNGKNFMLWGVIALFIMFSVWGIVQYAQNIFGIQGQNTIVIPSIKIDGAPVQTQQKDGESTCMGLVNGSPCGSGITAGTCSGGSCVPDVTTLSK